MNENKKNYNLYISLWLSISMILLVSMIIIGGLTRLTDSGLSITKWDLFSGIIPPLNITDWQLSFNLYKQIPEFKLLNSNMTLDEFKIIFWWEYIHRLLGRFIGLFFLIPLIFFIFKKCLNKKEIFNFNLIFLLIVFQGIIGWYMVKSGLIDRTDVSHYRLSIHLTIAFIIFGLLQWNYLIFINKNNLKSTKVSFPSNILVIFLFLIFFQISFGAFVSGLDAGMLYNTWPLMNESFFPDDSKFNELFNLQVLNDPSLVQFLHRIIAYIIFFFYIYILLKAFFNEKLIHLRKYFLIVLLFLLFQVFLGIAAVLSAAHIYVASLHQIGSILLVSTTILLIFKNSKIN